MDSHDRPCLGTIEKDQDKKVWSHLHTNGLMQRIKAIFFEIKASGAPINAGFARFNNKNQRSTAFHVKFFMQPAIYQQI